MHHSQEPLSDKLREHFGIPNGLGATGKFPEGKLTETDEGEIMMAVTSDVENRKVILNFGKPVVWVGYNAEQAIEFGALMIEHGKRIRRAIQKDADARK